MFYYLKNLISKDTPERVSAFLAVISGVILCFGFVVLIFKTGKSTELGIVTGGLVVLATFSKVDNKPDTKPDKPIE